MTDQSSYLSSKQKIRIADLKEAKRRKEKWVMLTSYDATSAKIFDMAKIPVLLVGDSAAQTVFGYKSTIPVTMDEMIPLARAVVSSCQRALVIGDMPFGSYQESPAVALRNATRYMKEAGVHAVKLEGGSALVGHIELLTQSGIPVMGHIGLTPQAEHMLSGYRVQGRSQQAMSLLIEEAKKLERAGVFACVIELVPTLVGESVTDSVGVPIVGIGAGPKTDAQVLVWNDMAGFSQPKGVGYLCDASDKTTESKEMTPDVDNQTSSRSSLDLGRAPKFVKRYANISEILYNAAISFAKDVRLNKYPAEEHCYNPE